MTNNQQQNPLQPIYDCLTYCEQQNGLPFCKNCGLDKDTIDKVVDTIRQEERRKTIEEIIKYIPQEDNTLKDAGHNLAQAALYGFQRGFNYCRKIVLSTLENKKHE